VNRERELGEVRGEGGKRESDLPYMVGCMVSFSFSSPPPSRRSSMQVAARVVARDPSTKYDIIYLENGIEAHMPVCSLVR
jgi:hypothetical protein